MPIGVLFYSNNPKCSSSQKIYKALQSAGITKDLKMFCVEEQRHNLPRIVKEICTKQKGWPGPIMVLKERDQPLIDQAIGLWISSYVSSRPSQASQSSLQPTQSSSADKPSGGQPDAFNPLVEDISSSAFASVGGNSASGGFSILGDAFPIQTQGGGANSNKKQNDFDKNYEKYITQRGLDAPKPIHRT